MTENVGGAPVGTMTVDVKFDDAAVAAAEAAATAAAEKDAADAAAAAEKDTDAAAAAAAAPNTLSKVRNALSRRDRQRPPGGEERPGRNGYSRVVEEPPGSNAFSRVAFGGGRVKTKKTQKTTNTRRAKHKAKKPHHTHTIKRGKKSIEIKLGESLNILCN